MEANAAASPMSRLTGWAEVIGRIAIGIVFLWSGWGKFLNIPANVSYMQAYGFPAAEVLVWVAVLIEVIGGIMIIVGWKARFAAAVLFLFTLVASFVFHGYWGVAAGEAMTQQIAFMKNVAIMGGLLLVFGHGPGRLSLGRS